MGEVYITDLALNKPIKVASIPATINTYSAFNGTLGANEQEWVTWTTTPTLPQTSLWNYAVSIRLGTNSSGYTWPNGSSLTTNQQLVQVSVVRQALGANERTNVVVHTVVMRNESADSFAYYMYFKTWTFATSIGTSA